MVLFWITLVLALSGSNADGEFCILHSPDSLKFIPSGETWESTLKEIFSAALGLSVAYDSEWQGLQIKDPFNTPEAAVDVHIDGISGLGTNIGFKSKIFPLHADEYEPDTFRGVKLRIKQRFDSGGNEIVNFKLSEVTQFNGMNTVFGKMDGASYKMNFASLHLKQGVLEDRQFMTELRTLRAVIEKVKDGVLSPDKLIDFYNFRFRSLHTLSDYYGPFSNQTKEAMKLLGEALQELSKAFVKAYDGSVLVTVVTNEVSHSRRSARAVSTKPLGHSKKWSYKWLDTQQEKKYKAAQTSGRQETDAEIVGDEGRRRSQWNPDDSNPWTDTKPTSDSQVGVPDDLPQSGMFNILLQLGLLWFFSMLAIVYLLMAMEPGRDTIIYRMTANKSYKKNV